MKIAVCYFTFVKDTELLKQSMRSVERLRRLCPEVEADIFVFDDGENPLSAIPDGVTYTTTSWDRKGNLNGVENFYAMLDVYSKLTDYDWIVKVDCDSYINSWDWVASLDPSKYAKAGSYNHLPYQHGCLYALSTPGVAKMVELASDELVRNRIASGPAYEDAVFSAIAGMTGMAGARYSCAGNVLGGSSGVYHDAEWEGLVPVPRMENPDPNLMLKHLGVTFKRYSASRTAEEREQDRAEALERMTAYADWVDANAETIATDALHVEGGD